MANLLFTVKLEDDDRALLDACSKFERLTRSDIVRRALRHYAEHLGVKPEQQKPKRKK
ncbi:MAG: CopG family transcriptional regulator [Polyangiaceae bacterium]|nr:CopG family transcriptional regulator [Polyangiaceae bacterium]